MSKTAWKSKKYHRADVPQEVKPWETLPSGWVAWAHYEQIDGKTVFTGWDVRRADQ